MHPIADILISAFLVISGVFGFVGSFGLIKLKDPMSRLHAPTKATTLGVGGVLIASILHSIAAEGRLSLHELLITCFLFLTAPVTAHFIAKSNLFVQIPKESLPRPGDDTCWAVYNTEEQREEAAAD